ncbi:hypothetical protein GEMRC1_013393 [Eukaryota sp. GEM-RC1]
MLPGKFATKISAHILKSLQLIVLDRPSFKISDPVVAHGLLTVAKYLASSISMASTIESKQSVGELLKILISTVELNQSEAQLAFFSECRSMFLHFDKLQQDLVNYVLALVIKSKDHTQSKNLKNVEHFKACLAFAQITIPSFQDIVAQLKLFLSTAEVSLSLGLTVQYQELIQTSMELVPSIPPFLENSLDEGQAISSSPFVLSTIKRFCNLLSLSCTHPEHGAFHLFDLLLDGLRELYNAPKHQTFAVLHDAEMQDIKADQFGVHVKRMMAVVSGLVTSIERNNDFENYSSLYSMEDIKKECTQKVNDIIQEILNNYDPYGRVSDEAATVLLDIINVLIRFFEIGDLLVDFVRFISPILERSKVWNTHYGKNTLEKLQSIGVDVL